MPAAARNTGFTTMVYAIDRKVVKPPSVSRPSVEPDAEIAKRRSSR
jgi:hypothetical protein